MVIGLGPRTAVTSLPTSAIFDLVASMTRGPYFEDGDELFRMKADPDLKEKAEPEFAFDIAFDVPRARTRMSAIATLYAIYQFVSDDLLPQFSGFFPR